MTEQKKHSLVMAALENGEALVDFLTENEAVKSVPVVSTAVRVLEGFDDYRSRLLRTKLQRFLSDPSLIRSIKAQELRAQMIEDEEKLSSIGDNLFLIIDKVTDLEKPRLLAKVYAYLLDGGLNAEQFFLLSHAIDISATSDLTKFIETNGSGLGSEADWNERMATAGLLRTQLHNPTEFVVITKHHVSKMGRLLLDAVESARRP